MAISEAGAEDRVEAPSGKSAADENFPVGSALIHPRLRPHVAAFYAFARAADDVADHPDFAAAEKLRRLDRFEAGLDGAGGPDCALRLRESLRETGVPDRHARDLLAAFRQDATVRRYRGWRDLLGYCALSAHPVGRFLLDLHGERRDAWPPSDALCAALQVLNHLQDLQPDFRRLDRVYLPLDWLEAEGEGVDALDRSAASPGLRRAIDRALDGCDALIDEAAPLPRRLRSARLAGESAAILRLARRLGARLRRGDPLAGRVALSKLDFLGAAAAGVAWSARVTLTRSP